MTYTNQKAAGQENYSSSRALRVNPESVPESLGCPATTKHTRQHGKFKNFKCLGVPEKQFHDENHLIFLNFDVFLGCSGGQNRILVKCSCPEMLLNRSGSLENQFRYERIILTSSSVICDVTSPKESVTKISNTHVPDF